MSTTLDPARTALLPRRAPGGVLFTFETPPGVQQVAVAGTFNSWVGDTCPLTRTGPTTWQATLPIATGRHLYKYVVDGTQWIRDPANPWVSEDGQNNSSFTVDDQGGVFVRQGTIDATHPTGVHRRHAALKSPGWLRDGVVYQLSVRAFGGTFAGLRQRLDYLGELGVTVIWLMPVFPIGIERRTGSLGDPYAVRDFTAIDPALGDADGLRALVDDLHARGMRVVLDWTLNRASRDNVLTVEHPEWFTHDARGELHYAVPLRDHFAGFDFSQPALRHWLIEAMKSWLTRFGFDGLRFDDSDITPLDFLSEIRAALTADHPHIGIISQAYDEFHHLDSCDLTYEGGTRDLIHQVARGDATSDDFAAYWNASTYSFPRGALRLRWLEEKEQGRATALFGRNLHHAAAAIVLTLDGVPHLLMGQEFDEPSWRTWTSLFEPFELDWSAFDDDTFHHHQALIRLRNGWAALRQGSTEFISGLPPGVIGYWRRAASQAVQVVVNLSGNPVELPAEMTGLTSLYARGLGLSAQGNPDLAPFGCVIATDGLPA
ncbi:alpha-amylase family glycosyl hydrolase [Rhizobacter sp. Root1221]|uniref:alpha-amylase family glycosyl hydrolase n=1 Tax=Rhizobacter sp. Root1221 TaxID=1736433 RepID=UPI0006F25737|nr:alpha-amylase family glycosyl hydrolase [Rhizobacter sp. Root1221]KQW03088.1 hypothetical protein ASC87_01790 [Rhizobacter sp. Root1221]